MRSMIAILAAAVLTSSAGQTGFAAEGWIVDWDGSRLTVRANKVPLRTLLEQVEQRTQVVVQGRNDIDAIVSVDVEGLPVKAALDEILSVAKVGYGFIEFTEEGESRPRLLVVVGNKGVAAIQAFAGNTPGPRPDEVKFDRQEPASNAQPKSEPQLSDTKRDSDRAEIDKQGQPRVSVMFDDFPFDPRQLRGNTQ